MNDEWLVFTGGDIRKYLDKISWVDADFARLLNVSPPTLHRWLTGSAPPTASAVLILAMLLRGEGIVASQRKPPTWWDNFAQRKRKKARKSGAAQKRVADTSKIRDLFHFQRLLPNGIGEIAVSPKGFTSAKKLAKKMATCLALLEEREAGQSKPAQDGGHFLGGQDMFF